MKNNEVKSGASSGIELAFIPLAVGLNIGIGTIVQILKLPIFLDSIGTIITACIFGWWIGAIVGVLSFMITSITTFPPAIYFSGTQVCIAVYVYLVAKNGGYRTYVWTAFSGIGLALLAAVVSAPVIYYLFGGLTGNGVGFITIYFQSIGINKPSSVLISGILAEMIDKTLQVIIAIFIVNSIPKFMLSKINNELIIKNFL